MSSQRGSKGWQDVTGWVGSGCSLQIIPKGFVGSMWGVVWDVRERRVGDDFRDDFRAFFFFFASTAERLNLPFPQESVGDENLSSRWLNMGV